MLIIVLIMRLSICRTLQPKICFACRQKQQRQQSPQFGLVRIYIAQQSCSAVREREKETDIERERERERSRCTLIEVCICAVCVKTFVQIKRPPHLPHCSLSPSHSHTLVLYLPVSLCATTVAKFIQLFGLRPHCRDASQAAQLGGSAQFERKGK